VRRGAAAVLVAAGLDAVLGEPPARLHPVVWYGRYLRAAERLVPASPPARATAAGGLALAVGATTVAAGAGAVDRWAARLPAGTGALAVGAALWPLFSVRILLAEGHAVEARVAADTEDGRVALSRIVSRDVRGLDASGVREAMLESIAENLSDSVTAPLLWFAVGGLPAAATYRLVNTADAMWGYTSSRWRYAGRAAARADDLVNLLPARLTGAAVLCWPGGSHRPGSRRWRVLRREARRTTSPNAGWPMAALALRLGLRLGKRGAYLLNPDGRAPQASDTAQALAVLRRVAVGCVVAAAALAWAVRTR